MQALRKRRRPPRSCKECRRRKVKCDRNEPCSHCVLIKRSCNYDLEYFKSAARVETPNPQNASSKSRQKTSSTPVVTSEAATIRKETPLEDQSTQAPNKDHQLAELSRRVQTLEQLFSAFTPTLATEGSSSSALLVTTGYKGIPYKPQNKRLALNKSRLFGQTHWSNGVPELGRLAVFLSNEHGSNTDNEATKRLKSETYSLRQRCKVLAKSSKTSRPSRCISVPDPNISTRSFADRMAQLYISRFESAFRILHIPTFWTEYGQYWNYAAETADVLKYKVQLVIAIGSSLNRDDRNEAEVLSSARQWVHAAQNWISGPMEKGQVSISGLQIQCLLILARQTLSVSGDLIWIAMGALTRTAMQMGLHRDPKHFMKMSILQAEIRRRLWATILEMNLQASLDSGVPPTISLDDFDTNLPSNADDRDLDDGVGTLEQMTDMSITDSSLQRFLFQCLRPRLEVLRRMNGLGSDITHEEVLSLSSEISNACRECSSYVKKGSPAEGEVFRQNLADLLLRRFLLTLHRPWVSRARSNPLFYYSRKVCLDSGSALISPAPNEDFSRLVQLGSGIFKCRIIHAALALTSELLIEIEEQDIRSSSSYRKMIVDAVKEARLQCFQRIQLGETNVRLYVKLSVALSLTEGTEDGISLSQRMAQAAKDSLEESYAAIQARSALSNALLHFDESNLTSQESDLGFDSLDYFDFGDVLQGSDFPGTGYLA